MSTTSQPVGHPPLDVVIPGDRILTPGTPGFDESVALWNGAVTRRPTIVVQPTSVSEVQAAVRHARTNDIALSVRGGGHDWAGRALADGGLVIDMSRMRQVTVETALQTASVSGGATAADVIAATEPHGLVAATGTFGAVGIVGLTLAGGYGPLGGIAGLALDNAVAFTVVLPDGEAVTVDEHREPDLFWALRGGGGNFGVVAEMRIRLHAVPAVVAGFIAFPWHQAADVLRGFDVLRPTMPDELTVQSGVLPGPDGAPVVFLSPTWSGDATAAGTWMDRLSALGTPLMAQIAPMSYSAMLKQFEPYVVDGRHYEMRTRTVSSLTEGAIEALIEAGQNRTSPFSGIAIHHFHGAPSRIPLEDTAFGIRSPHMVVEILAAWDPDDDPTPHRRWADDVYADLEPHSLDGGYPNLIGPDQAAQADSSYGPNAGRLAAIKRRYDPDNVFSATTLPSQ